MLNKKGFTLIELLIVVAIIAILAAIAIPNFLQAQIRSKVSRTKADMRSVATGLETYYVDNNDYPMCNRYTTAGSGIDLGRKNFHIPDSLTTPIAYITSYPMDPFERFGGGQNPLKYIKAGPMYNDGALYLWYVNLPVTWPLADESTPVAKYYGPNNPANEIETGFRWFMFSCGPDGDLDTNYGLMMYGWYDPTNGTVSNGNIVRTNDNYGS